MTGRERDGKDAASSVDRARGGASRVFHGGCHCGALGLVFETGAPVELRACACSFCGSHGARTTTDPAGGVRLFVSLPDRLVRYRFGLRTADYLLCGHCGVYVAAVAGGRCTVNANTFGDALALVESARPVRYDGESAEARRKRRGRRWTPIVETLEGDRALRADLLAMQASDLSVRTELIEAGTLADGYHPRMETLHARNAARLQGILEAWGWPRTSEVGQDGSNAAWLVLQHAIGHPALMRRGLALLQGEAQGEVDPAQVAMLEDRIHMYEGKPQRYGTQFAWDENGELSAHPVDDPSLVDERRRNLRMEPLAAQTAIMRRRAAEEAQHPPADYADWKRQYEEWLRRVGWRA